MRMPTDRSSAFAMALALALGAAAFPAQPASAADDKPAGQEAQDADSLLDYSHEQKDEAVSWADRQLTAIGAKIDEMERNWDRSETKADLEALKADLADKREDAEDELADLGEAGADAWDEAKVEARDALDALESAYQDTRRRIAD